MYEAGFGSSSRLYEKATEKLGMTPAVYKKGGKGMDIKYVTADTELGKILVARTRRGICSVTFGDSAKALVEDLDYEFPNAVISEGGEELSSAVDAIIKYLSGKSKRLVLPLDLQATAFQMQVWELLRQIPYGETRSYTQIAEQLGDKQKVRGRPGMRPQSRCTRHPLSPGHRRRRQALRLSLGYRPQKKAARSREPSLRPSRSNDSYYP